MRAFLPGCRATLESGSPDACSGRVYTGQGRPDPGSTGGCTPGSVPGQVQEQEQVTGSRAKPAGDSDGVFARGGLAQRPGRSQDTVQAWSGRSEVPE